MKHADFFKLCRVEGVSTDRVRHGMTLHDEEERSITILNHELRRRVDSEKHQCNLFCDSFLFRSTTRWMLVGRETAVINRSCNTSMLKYVRREREARQGQRRERLNLLTEMLLRQFVLRSRRESSISKAVNSLLISFYCTKNDQISHDCTK